MKDLNVVLDVITKEISQNFPQIADILEKASAGDMTEEEALFAMMSFTSENPDIANQIADIFMSKTEKEEVLENEEETLVVAQKPSVEKKSFEGMQIWEDRSDQNKRARFNPQYEGYLIERLQFDGDIPELRTGPMPDGATPAVPVETKATNPVVIGSLLKSASEIVHEEIKTLTEEHRAKLEEKSEAGTLELTNTYTGLTHSEVPQPKGYEIGKLADFKRIEEPTGSELSSLTLKERRELVWGFISTSQGRRSVTETMKEIVSDQLAKKGLAVTVRDTPVSGRVVSASHWSFSIEGAYEIQDRFSFVETASYSLSHALKRNLKEDTDPDLPIYLEIETINVYSAREVGWGARLMQEKGNAKD